MLREPLPAVILQPALGHGWPQTAERGSHLLGGRRYSTSLPVIVNLALSTPELSPRLLLFSSSCLALSASLLLADSLLSPHIPEIDTALSLPTGLVEKVGA